MEKSTTMPTDTQPSQLRKAESAFYIPGSDRTAIVTCTAPLGYLVVGIMHEYGDTRRHPIKAAQTLSEACEFAMSFVADGPWPTKRGRPTIGDEALSGSERNRRWKRKRSTASAPDTQADGDADSSTAA